MTPQFNHLATAAQVQLCRPCDQILKDQPVSEVRVIAPEWREFHVITERKPTTSRTELYQATLLGGYLLGLVAVSFCSALGFFSFGELLCYLSGSVLMLALAVSFQVAKR